MATKRKTPLSEAASSKLGRAERSANRSSVARKRLAIGAVALAVIAGAAAFMVTRGSEDGLFGLGTGNNEPPTPKFHFRVGEVKVLTTTATPPGQVEDKAGPVAEEVARRLDTLYSGAFVDPDVWEDGDYEDLFSHVMDQSAAGEAMKDLATLTLGEDAGAAYRFVDPKISTLKISVLTGPDDEPVQAIAEASFLALAQHDDGTYTKVTSDGTYFLKRIEGEWRIFSFDVSKGEKEAEAPTSATPTAEGSA